MCYSCIGDPRPPKPLLNHHFSYLVWQALLLSCIILLFSNLRSVLYFLDFIYDEIWDQANDDQFLYIRVFMCLLLFSLTSCKPNYYLTNLADYNGKFFTCLSLDRENSNWCWSSYAYGAAVGVYVLFYSIFYYHNSEMSGMAQYQIYTLYNCITVLFFSLVSYPSPP